MSWHPIATRVACGAGCIIALAAGTWVVHINCSALEEAIRSEQWPSVRGRITSSEVGYIPCGEGGMMSCSLARVRYQYSVAGTEFEGRRVDFLNIAPNTSNARDIVAAFPERASIAIYYDPASPSRSVLRPGPDWLASLPFFVFGLVLLGRAVPLGLGVIKPRAA